MKLIVVKNVSHRLGNDEFYYFHPGLDIYGDLSPAIFTRVEIASAKERAKKAHKWKLSRDLLPAPEPKKPGFWEWVKEFLK